MKLKPKSKKSDSTPKLVLEEIIGITTKDGNGLVSNAAKGDCVYLAGCVVVIYNIDKGTQSHLMLSSRMPKPLSCVSVPRPHGCYIAAGEKKFDGNLSGHQPAVLVWEYSTRTLLAELKGHRYGVACLGFSPDGKHLVSIGFPRDGYLCVWDWRNRRVVSKFKASASCSAISSVCFSADGSFFVTAGKKHLKLWTVSAKPRTNASTGLLITDGKAANVGCQKGNTFTAVASSAGTVRSIVGRQRAIDLFPIYALTDAGVLCVIHSGFSIRRWVDLKVDKGLALSVSNNLIACACSSGIVQLFTVDNFKYAGSVRYPEANDRRLAPDVASHANPEKCTKRVVTAPDAIACEFLTSEKLVVVYGDHSLYLWDVHDIPKVSGCCIFVSHSGCIWDIKNLPCKNLHDPALACVARGDCFGVSFATCSADGTIRLWDIELEPDSEKDSKPEIALNQHFHGSLSTEQVGTIHLDTHEQDTAEPGIGAQGFRSMACSFDGTYLAAGDCLGNLHIYNLRTSDYTCFQDAHDGEILSLSFSLPNKTHASTFWGLGPHHLLASAGRDQVINVHDINRSFNLIGSLKDHSSAVISVKLTCNGCSILSCSADKSVVFRDVDITDAGLTILRQHDQIASHGRVYDMAIDPKTNSAVTVGQDKKINIFSITSRKLIKAFKPDPDFGEPIKVTMDPTSSFLVCCYSNRSFSIYDFAKGVMVNRAMGHAEVVTGVTFLPDCKHIISVGGDSCIFVWRLPTELSSIIIQKMIELTASPSPKRTSQLVVQSEGILHEEVCHQSNTNLKDIDELRISSSVAKNEPVEGGVYEVNEAFKFRISRLPKWARTRVTTKQASHGDPESILPQVAGDCEAIATIGSISPAGVHTPRPACLRNSQIHPIITSESPISSDADENSQEIRSFGMGKRWRTIHTVCLDLHDSPEIRDCEDIKLPFSVHNLCSGEGSDILCELTTIDSLATRPICDPCKEAVNHRKGCDVSEKIQWRVIGNLSENKDQSHFHSTDASCEALVSKASVEQTYSGPSQIPGHAAQEVEKYQNDDIFSQHFSNLSTSLKVKGRRSSARRSFSSRFFMHCNHLSNCKELFETSIENLGNKASTSFHEAAHLSSSWDLSDHPSEESQLCDICDQDGENSRACSMGVSKKSNSTYSTLTCILKTGCIEEGEQRQEIQKGNEMHERFTGCRNALLSLDAASETALRLFQELGTPITQEDATNDLRADLYNSTLELLPLVMRRVFALADLVQSSKTSSNLDARVEDSEFEALRNL